MDNISEVYGLLLEKHMDAFRDRNEGRRKRIFDATNLMRELWPKETSAWENPFPSPKDSAIVGASNSR